MNYRPTPNPERRNRTFEEIQKEEEAKKKSTEAKPAPKRPRKPLNLKLPRIFPQIRLKKSVQYLLAFVAVLGLFGVVNSYQAGMVCENLNIQVESKEENAFLTQAEIEKIIEEGYKKDILGAKMRTIELAKVEEALKKSPYIADAQVTKGFRGALQIDVKLREPIARVINTDGGSLYVDVEGVKFPSVHRHSSNVPLIRGTLTETLTPVDSFSCELIGQAFPVIKRISLDPFWKQQISEIYITQSNELIFYPQIGNIYIEFGDARRIDEKLENMTLFYDQIIKEIGWSKYKGFSVKYKGQVVAKRI